MTQFMFAIITFVICLMISEVSSTSTTRSLESGSKPTSTFYKTTKIPVITEQGQEKNSIFSRTTNLEGFNTNPTLPTSVGTSVSCEWAPKIQCQNNTLNLEEVGCANQTDVIKQTMPLGCSKQGQRNISCTVCSEWGTWSVWSPCCRNTSCPNSIFGNLTKYRKVRHRNLSVDCIKTFSIDPSCFIQVQNKTCRGEGRAFINTNEENKSQPISAIATTMLFAVAGVVMIALFGFAGNRLYRTMHRKSPTPVSTMYEDNINERRQSQYSNASFQSFNSDEASTERYLNPESQVLVIRRVGHRMAPPHSHLSIIPEEDDVISTSIQDVDKASSDDNSSLSSSRPSSLYSNKDIEALDFMNGIITQIEEDESKYSQEDENPRKSLSEASADGLLSNFGWNPIERHHGNKFFRLEKMKGTGSTEALTGSALSLASASLLKAALPSNEASPAMTPSVMTSMSSLSESADSYSLKDMSSLKQDPLLNISRSFASLPDISRLTDCVPDINEILSESDLNNSHHSLDSYS